MVIAIIAFILLAVGVVTYFFRKEEPPTTPLIWKEGKWVSSVRDDAKKPDDPGTLLP